MPPTETANFCNLKVSHRIHGRETFQYWSPPCSVRPREEHGAAPARGRQQHTRQSAVWVHVQTPPVPLSNEIQSVQAISSQQYLCQHRYLLRY